MMLRSINDLRISKQEKESAGQAPIIFAFAILFVFLFLAALYESWAVPFAVLFAGPSSRTGESYSEAPYLNTRCLCISPKPLAEGSPKPPRQRPAARVWLRRPCGFREFRN